MTTRRVRAQPARSAVRSGRFTGEVADGFHGWQDNAPYDAIIVTAASETIPPPLLDQLKLGGKMIIPLGSHFSVQNLVLVTKGKDAIHKENLLPVRFVPFTREKK